MMTASVVEPDPPHRLSVTIGNDAEKIILEGEDADALKLQALGHKQEMKRNFSLWSIAALGFVNGNAWSALGGSILVAIYNGGPTGVLFELLAVTIAYAFITASLAELASSIPSSGGVYHWATVVSGPKYGRIVGFFAGWYNLLAWIFATSSTCAILGNALVSCYLTAHPDVEWHPWQVFVAFQLLNWLGCAIVVFGNRWLPMLNYVGSFLVAGGVFISIVVVATMPKKHSSTHFVWSTFSNNTGWSNNGLVFLMGMLNGAYSIGTPDATTHISEEVHKPEINVPRAMFFQLILGFATAFAFVIAISYAISDLDTVLSLTSNFPLTQIYFQATGTTSGAIGLTVIIFLAYASALPDTFIASGRTFWALSRDRATPYAEFFSRVSPTWDNPVRANIFCATFTTCIGCIYVGSTTAFNAFVGAFVVLTTISYGISIAAHMSTRRKSVIPGPFHLGKYGWAINVISLLYIIMSDILFCFPFVQPVTAQNMNYVCVIVGGFSVWIAFWWLVSARKNYEGPKYIPQLMATIEGLPTGTTTETQAVRTSAEKVT